MSSRENIFSAPGSLMLMGEHAVLHGRRALVAAINRRVRVRLGARPDRQVCIRSALGSLDISLDRLVVRPPFTFVLAALRKFRRRLTHGLDITIEADFSHTLGFGSSAAVTVALLGALTKQFQLFQPTFDRVQWLRAAIAIIRAVQGTGSGADAAASLLGGIVLYRADPLEFRSLAVAPQLAAVYSGHKEPTAKVIALVDERCRRHPQLFEGVFTLMDACVEGALPLVRRKKWTALGQLMNLHHGLQTALGTNTPALESICDALRRAPGGTGGAKISGSGLGDCAIAFGRPRGAFAPYQLNRLRVDRRGARVENRLQE